MVSAMKSLQTVKVSKKEVSCDGGAGSLGHPKVYLNFGTKVAIDCPYCGCHFVLQSSKK